MTLEEIVNNLKSAGQDYGQLFNNNPRMDNFASVLQQGLGQLIPSNADFKSPEAMRDWGTAAALNAPMGLTFTGPKSMGWNHDAANTATKLLDNGADPAQVWKDHMILRMPDNSLFSEIDDSGVNYISPPLKFGGYLGDSISDSSIFNEYPKLGYINIKEGPKSFYDHVTKKNIGIKENSKNKKSVALHEVQHAIQDNEGWATGGNPSMIDESMYGNDFLKKINEYRAMIDKNPHALQSIHNISQDAKIDGYYRLTGEAQARATQDRMNMNMQQRRDTYPLAGGLLSDIPLDQLINRYGDNGPSMSMSIKNPNLNFELLNKHLSGQKLTPEEMALYEKNGSAMETPQLQRYNVANAMANPERQAYKDTLNVPVYHGTNDVITAPDYAFSGKGADQLGSAALYTSKEPSLANGFVKPDISGGNVLPLVLRNTSKYMSDELEKKLTPAQIREFITKSPDEYALSNFGDVGYEGKNKVINTAVQGYPQYGDEKLLDTLNTLNNDFYTGHPEEFNKLAEKLTKKAGVVMDTGENKIYATWNPKDIRSRFAAFDPLRKNSSSLLASGLLGSLLLKQMNQESSQQ